MCMTDNPKDNSLLSRPQVGVGLHAFDITTRICHFCGRHKADLPVDCRACTQVMQPALASECVLSYMLNQSLAYEFSEDKQHGERY